MNCATPVYGIQLQEIVQDFSLFSPVVFEECFVQLSAQAVGALAVGAQRCTEDNITEQVKWVSIGLVGFSSQGFKANAFTWSK